MRGDLIRNKGRLVAENYVVLFREKIQKFSNKIFSIGNDPPFQTFMFFFQEIRDQITVKITTNLQRFFYRKLPPLCLEVFQKLVSISKYYLKLELLRQCTTARGSNEVDRGLTEV